MEPPRREYPITREKAALQAQFCRNQVVVIGGEPGIGKSSQIPQYVLEGVREECKSKNLVVACTQTVSLAAYSLAERVQEEMGLESNHVAYVTESEDNCCTDTVLKYMTDFKLVQEGVNDPLFRRYKAIIVDESDQHTLWTDALLAILKTALEMRNDLQAVIISSFRESTKFESYFDARTVRTVAFNPAYKYEDSLEEDYVTDYYAATSDKLEKLLLDTYGSGGNIVVFLPSENDVELMYEDFVKKVPKIAASLQIKGHCMGSVELLKLHPSLRIPLKKYKCSDGLPRRKLLFTTDIGETSFSLEDVAYVIDSGYTEYEMYDRTLGMEYRKRTLISRDVAFRRAKVGGNINKQCYRLYTYDDWTALDMYKSPEFSRCKLDHVACLLKKVDGNFKFINPPNFENLESSIDDLKKLGALDGLGQLTELGHMICQFPLQPALAKIVIAGRAFGCSDGAISVASMLLVPNCFKETKKPMIRVEKARRNFRHAGGDHLTLLNVYREYIKNSDSDEKWCEKNYLNQAALERAKALHKEVASIAVNLGLYNDTWTNDYDSNVKKAVFEGYSTSVAKLESCGHYTTLKGDKIVHLHPSSSVEQKPLHVMFSKYVPTETRDFIHIVSDIDPEWIQNEAGSATKCSFA